MAAEASNELRPSDVIGLVVRYRWRWLAPAVLIAAVAMFAARVKVDQWEASQGLVIRNEAVVGAEDPGRFRHGDQMKTVLETILELARSSAVLSATLEAVGPPPHRAGAQPWPLAEDIAALADRMQVAPPKGAEFGKTEVFYIKVRDPNRDRAVALVTAVADQLEERYNRLRDDRATGVVRELEEARRLATEKFDAVTQRVRELEAGVGGDLAELRSLARGNGDSDLRRKTLELENELRQARLTERSSRELLKVLEGAQSDPGRLLAAPQGLLDAQPALKRLKDGLVDSQLRTAALVGRMTESHPQVLAAREAEEEVSRQLQAEVAVVRRGVEVDQRLAADRVQSLESQLAQVRERLERLAGLRAEYSNLLDELDQQSRMVEATRRELSAAQAIHASARTASLLTRLDVPDAGTRPVGPSREIIAAAGIFGGLAVGFGFMVLTLPTRSTSSRAPLPDPFLEARVPTGGNTLSRALAKARAWGVGG